MAKNNTLWMVLGIIGAIVLVSVFFVIGTYNGLVKSDEDVNNKWSQIETVLQRRADLIPNLVATVQGAANFEKSTLTAVTEARTKWLQASGLNEKVAAGNQMDSALARLLVSVESYPDLKATANFLALQDEVANTENKISVERQRYNDAVTAFNKKIRTFPSNILAGMFGFEKRVYFESKAGAENAPVIAFD